MHTFNFRKPRYLTQAVIGLAALLVGGCATFSTAQKPPPLVFPTPTSSPAPLPTDPPSAVPPTPTGTPIPPQITRLTDPGCCAQPFWSADSSTVLFLDKPEPTAKTAIYGVPIAGGAPQVVSEQVGIPSPDGKYLTFLDESGQTAIRDTASGDQWTLDNGGRRPFFSPASVRVAWAQTIEESSSDFSRRRTVVSVANLDGGDAHEAITVYGGGIAGWLDDDRLLLTGRLTPDDPDVQIFVFNVTDSATFSLLHENRVRSVSVAPGGQWALYTVALDPTNSANDGLWVVRTDGSQRFRVEVIGGARWRDSTHLLIIPLDAGAPSHRLWQFDTADGKAEPITNPDVTSFRVAQGDWSVSPDGKYVVFLNEQDQALWLLGLPPVN